MEPYTLLVKTEKHEKDCTPLSASGSLPAGWRLVPLNCLCESITTVNPEKAPEDFFVYVDVSSVSNQSFSIIETKEIRGKDAPSRARKQIKSNDVIFATVRPTLKRIAVVPPELNYQICSTGFCVLRPKKERLFFKYLYYHLLSEKVSQYVSSLEKGATYPAINDSDLLGLAILLPPFPEQRAIAHILQTVQNAIQARRNELALERERKAALMQHLFTHGTRGEATKQTEIGEMPESWKISELGEVCQFLQYGTSEPCNEDSSGLPVLRIPNVINGYIDTQDLKFAVLPEKTVGSLKLASGDLLFVRTNGNRSYTGRCAMFNNELETALFASYLIRVRLKSDVVSPQFVLFYTMTQKGREYLSGKSSHAADGKFNINTQTIKHTLIPIPPFGEQVTIVAVIQACDSKIAALEKELALQEELFRALLEELMSGRLSALPLVEAEGGAREA